MSSVLFRERTLVVDALIEERRATGNDRFDEMWEGVYVVNPPPMADHGLITAEIHALLRSRAAPTALRVAEAVGIGTAQDYRIPDLTVFDPADLDDARHYLRTAAIVVEVRSPNERLDKRPFHRAHRVTEVVLVDPAAGTVEWFALSADGSAYDPCDASAVLPVGPADIAALLGP